MLFVRHQLVKSTCLAILEDSVATVTGRMLVGILALQAKGISCFGWEVRQKLRVLEYL